MEFVFHPLVLSPLGRSLFLAVALFFGTFLVKPLGWYLGWGDVCWGAVRVGALLAFSLRYKLGEDQGAQCRVA